MSMNVLSVRSVLSAPDVDDSIRRDTCRLRQSISLSRKRARGVLQQRNRAQREEDKHAKSKERSRVSHEIETVRRSDEWMEPVIRYEPRRYAVLKKMEFNAG